MFFNLHIVRLLFHFTSTRSWLTATMEGLDQSINTSGHWTKENDRKFCKRNDYDGKRDNRLTAVHNVHFGYYDGPVVKS